MNTDDLVLWRRRWSYHRSAWGAHHKTHSHKGIRVESGESEGGPAVLETPTGPNPHQLIPADWRG